MAVEVENDSSATGSNNDNGIVGNLHPFEVDFIQRLLSRGLKEDEIQVDYGLPRYTIKKAKTEIAARQYRSPSKREEPAVGEVLISLKEILSESISCMDSLAEDESEHEDIRTKAKELRAEFVEELQGILAAEKTSSDPYKSFKEGTERRHGLQSWKS